MKLMFKHNGFWQIEDSNAQNCKNLRETSWDGMTTKSLQDMASATPNTQTLAKLACNTKFRTSLCDGTYGEKNLRRHCSAGLFIQAPTNSHCCSNKS